MGRLIIHAPGVHIGGGRVLLSEVIKEVSNASVYVQIDERAQDMLERDNLIDRYIIKHSFIARLLAEIRLLSTSTKSDTILCFHGLPPIFPVRGKIIVFVQNRIHLEGKWGNTPYAFKTRLRLAVERLVCRLFKNHVSEYIVQTPSMKSALSNWLQRSNNPIRIIPFIQKVSPRKTDIAAFKEFDFIYVADGLEHKNHLNLLDAWIVLAEEGLNISLALTLSDRHLSLLKKIDKLAQNYGVRIHNLGELSHPQVLELYGNTKALVFPSICESFGLPLLEASQLGVPIIASELDYVRDVCVPAETFDPNSPISIARAIKRFLGVGCPTVETRTAREFIAELQ